MLECPRTNHGDFNLVTAVYCRVGCSSLVYLDNVVVHILIPPWPKRFGAGTAETRMHRTAENLRCYMM